ncbi:hypothetical protein ABIA52_001070 [Paenarthrobacter histidinolovorans]|uniref:Uncharacterized protein n=1 Tax=Paenarthrobacter histidinolovorans TaxID=43664 RepID=A0ABW8N4U0_9MICC
MGRGRTRVGDPLQCLRPADAELPRSGGCWLIGPGWLGLVVSPVRGIGCDGVTGRRCGEGAGFQRRGAIGAGGLGAGAASRRALLCLGRRSFRKVLRGAVRVVGGSGRRKRRGAALTECVPCDPLTTCIPKMPAMTAATSSRSGARRRKAASVRWDRRLFTVPVLLPLRSGHQQHTPGGYLGRVGSSGGRSDPQTLRTWKSLESGKGSRDPLRRSAWSPRIGEWAF